jgi:hypothetical protein
MLIWWLKEYDFVSHDGVRQNSNLYVRASSIEESLRHTYFFCQILRLVGTQDLLLISRE